MNQIRVLFESVTPIVAEAAKLSTLEIVAGVMLILAAIVVIVSVLTQEPKGQGLSSVMTGTEMMTGESRARSKDARQAKFTRVFAIVFFVLALLANIFAAFS